MPEVKANAGSELKTFVQESIKQVEHGLPKGYEIKGDLNFELSVVDTSKKKAGVDIKVLKLGGNVDKEVVQKIRFVVGKPVNIEEQMSQVKQIFSAMVEGLSKPKKQKKQKKKD